MSSLLHQHTDQRMGNFDDEKVATCLQARPDAYKFQVEAMMEDRGLSLNHKTNKGHALPVQLQMTAALVGLHFDILGSIQNDD